MQKSKQEQERKLADAYVHIFLMIQEYLEHHKDQIPKPKPIDAEVWLWYNEPLFFTLKMKMFQATIQLLIIRIEVDRINGQMEKLNEKIKALEGK